MQPQRAASSANVLSTFFVSFGGWREIFPGFASGFIQREVWGASFSLAHTERERGGGGGPLFPLKQWELRGGVQQCAHECLGPRYVCGSLARGLHPKKNLSQHLTMNPHKVEAPRGHRSTPFVLHFKTHKHVLIKRLLPGPSAGKREFRGRKGAKKWGR